MDQKFLPAATVKRQLAAVGSRAVTVTFMKKNGEISTRNGLPKVYKRRVGGDSGAKQAQVLRDNGLVFMDYPKPKVTESGKTIGGFSFKLDRVISINADGATIAAR